MLRLRKKMSARAASLAAGFSESYLGKVEKGECSLSLESFARIAHMLGMTDAEIALIVRWEAQRVAVTPNVHTQQQ